MLGALKSHHNGLHLKTALGFLLLTAGIGSGCGEANPPVAAAPPPSAAASNAPTTVTPIATQTAAKPTPQAAAHPAFDSEKAFALLKKQCDFGPRVLGTEAHEKTKAFLVEEMKKYADTTLEQTFTYRNLTGTNIIGVFNPAGATLPASQPVLLLTHWDARPIADGPNSSETRRGIVFRYGPNGWKPTAPISAACDGASGVAVLLELARLFHEKKPAAGVVLLLDDAEDYGDFNANDFTGEGVELGAKYFSEHYKELKAVGTPAYGILLDMVGGKGAFFPREQYSQQNAQMVNDKVYGIAQALGYSRQFRSNETQDVGDDHIWLNKAGIPTIDLIHPLPLGDYAAKGYAYWHTTQDTPDKCSPQSLKVIGDVVAEVIYREP